MPEKWQIKFKEGEGSAMGRKTGSRGGMGKADPLKDFLRRKGCPEEVIEGGLTGLIEAWGQVVKSVERGYLLTLDDYLNDLDGRQLLEAALKVIPPEEREKYHKKIRPLDEAMRSLVKPAGKCLWGEEVAEAEGWTAKKNWWYFHRPLKGDPDFLAEIDEA